MNHDPAKLVSAIEKCAYDKVRCIIGSVAAGILPPAKLGIIEPC